MNPVGAVGIAWVALVAACAPAAHDGLHPGAASTTGGDDVAHVIAAAPGTYALRLGDDTRACLVRQLERGSLGIARLTLVDLRPHAAQALKGVRVFVENPDADATTPPDADSAAGAFVLGPEPRETVVLNIAPALELLWASGGLQQTLAEGGSLRLTFVAEPWDFASSLPADFALPFARATLDVPCPDPERASQP